MGALVSLVPIEAMRAALTTFKDRASVRMDGWVNHMTGFGTSRDKTMGGFVMPSRILTDDELSSLYHGDDMAARMVDVVPQEMLREGFSLETGEPKIDAILADKMEAIDVRGKLVEGLRWGRAFGGAGLLIGADDGRDATLPLIPERAKDLSYLYAIDRRMLWPMSYYDQPGDPKLGQVETYMVTIIGGTAFQTSVVHESRLILFRGANTGIRERVQLAGWDLSVMQRAYEILRQFNTGWKAVETLMTDGNQAIFKMTGLADSIGSGGEELLRARLQVMDLYRSVMRALVIDADGKESFERHAASFAGIPDTLDKFMLRLAAAVQIPVTILMGQSPAGMSATGDSDFRWFYDRIRAEQTTMLAPKIRRLADIWMKTKVGRQLVPKMPDQLSVKFPALWTETPLVQAQRRLALAQSDDIYVKNQTLLPDEVALARFRHGDGFADEITLSDDSIKAREKALKGDIDKILDDAEGDNDSSVTDEDVTATSDLLKLAPTDLAAIVKVNEARASVLLPPLPGKDGELTLSQFKAKYATVIAAAANAESGTTDDGSGFPHQSTVGVQDPKPEPKPQLPPAFGAPGAPPAGGPVPPPGEKGPDGKPVAPAPNAPSLNSPKPKGGEEVRQDAGPRPFELHRDIDETGISGTGKVAEGCEFNDGTVAMRWVGKHQSTTVFQSMTHMLAVHGHGGKTRALYTNHTAAGEPLPIAPLPGVFSSSDVKQPAGGALPVKEGAPRTPGTSDNEPSDDET